jgi:hypothetical protein
MSMVWRLALPLVLVSGVAWAQEIKADNAAAIKAALASAGPGDTVVIKPGEYDLGGSVATGKDGTKDQPVTLRCEGDKGYAVLKVRGDVGFRIRSKFWEFRGIHFKSDRKSVEDLVFMDGPGGAGNIHIVDCKISGAGEFGMKGAKGGRDKPAHNVVIEHTEMYDVVETGFDLVSGDNWVLRGCYVHDYGSGGGVHYGIFLKGGGKNGIIEGCIVDGSAGKGTLGISFGGGLTGRQWLPMGADGKVGPEADGGIARNNIVIKAADSSYHSNNGANCKFYNNLAWAGTTFQRQAAYPKDPVLVNNLIGGGVKGASDNRSTVAPRKEWFVNPDDCDFRLTEAGKAALVGKGEEVPLEENPTDFFGAKREAGKAVLGPVLPDAKESTKWVDRRK